MKKKLKKKFSNYFSNFFFSNFFFWKFFFWKIIFLRITPGPSASKLIKLNILLFKMDFNFSLPAASLWSLLLKWILAIRIDSMGISQRLQCFLSRSQTCQIRRQNFWISNQTWKLLNFKCVYDVLAVGQTQPPLTLFLVMSGKIDFIYFSETNLNSQVYPVYMLIWLMWLSTITTKRFSLYYWKLLS